jgi:uncharacterized membrane protein
MVPSSANRYDGPDLVLAIGLINGLYCWAAQRACTARQDLVSPFSLLFSFLFSFSLFGFTYLNSILNFVIFAGFSIMLGLSRASAMIITLLSYLKKVFYIRLHVGLLKISNRHEFHFLFKFPFPYRSKLLECLELILLTHSIS